MAICFQLRMITCQIEDSHAGFFLNREKIVVGTCTSVFCKYRPRFVKRIHKFEFNLVKKLKFFSKKTD
jgi:hypothetical protein